jgi:hypothetical protein
MQVTLLDIFEKEQIETALFCVFESFEGIGVGEARQYHFQ